MINKQIKLRESLVDPMTPNTKKPVQGILFITNIT